MEYGDFQSFLRLVTLQRNLTTLVLILLLPLIFVFLGFNKACKSLDGATKPASHLRHTQSCLEGAGPPICTQGSKDKSANLSGSSR